MMFEDGRLNGVGNDFCNVVFVARCLPTADTHIPSCYDEASRFVFRDVQN